ncbi:hypothetical protein [Kineothrix sedimenti]|uniref:Uncharacterized protein n=1 Tax=Kineothrix sedimenti TaxID=3123317 RepID=A0ABZ3F342_9FIRM
MKNLILETNICIGYGYMCYLEFECPWSVSNFMDNFNVWGGSTKIYKNYRMFELSEEVMTFIQSPAFKAFLSKSDVKLITNNDLEYNDAIRKVYDQ